MVIKSVFFLTSVSVSLVLEGVPHGFRHSVESIRQFHDTKKPNNSTVEVTARDSYVTVA